MDAAYAWRASRAARSAIWNRSVMRETRRFERLRTDLRFICGKRFQANYRQSAPVYGFAALAGGGGAGVVPDGAFFSISLKSGWPGGGWPVAPSGASGIAGVPAGALPGAGCCAPPPMPVL